MRKLTIAVLAAAVLLGGCNQLRRMAHSMTGQPSSSPTYAPDNPADNMVVANASAPVAPAAPAAAAVPQRDPYNALIGIWTSTDARCGTLMFAAGSLTMTPPPGATYAGQTLAVDYQVNSPTDVIVILTDNSKPPKDIQLSDSQHMTFENCAYNRAA